MPAPAAPAGDAPDDPLRLVADGLVYVLDGPPRKSGRRQVVVTVRLADAGDGPPLVDRCDLYAHRSRLRLAALVAETFARSGGEVMGHLALLLDQAERALGREPRRPAPVALDPAARRAADALLGTSDLLERVARALDRQGHVGEERVKRLVYLAATSRLLAQPLSVLLQAPSGAGKSAVLEAVAALLPPEAVVSLSRLTPMSLYYMGTDALRHKLVVVDEYEGQAEADHAVRVLQSKGELTLTATIRGRAESFLVRGPVAVASGTTRGGLDPQNSSRCLELTLDDGPEQTRRIHQARARAWAGETGARRDGEVQAFVDAQRLLEPLPVVIPFAPRLSFPARTTADRRASGKLLGLVAAHALLFQRQRARDAWGRVVATPADYAAVHALVAPEVAREVDGLSPRAARVYQLLAAEPGRARTRRDLAAQAGWNYMTAARALAELVAQELVVAHDGPEPPRRYRLLPAPVLGARAELTSPDALA